MENPLFTHSIWFENVLKIDHATHFALAKIMLKLMLVQNNHFGKVCTILFSDK